VRFLVSEIGANVNQAKHNGVTPLFVAAWRGNLAVVQCLAKVLGADFNLANKNGATPLYIAAHESRLDVVQCLVNDFGADVDRANANGATPLYIAVQNGHVDVVRCMVSELSANVNQAMHNGYTPLMSTARVNNQALIKHLVHKGADLRAVSKIGGTAIIRLKASGATAEQIAYLKVRECCANPGCDGGGRKRCCVCKAMRYCGMACRVAHWRVHRGCCRPPTDAESEESEMAE
jgi:ankyrin repeat protein